MEFAKKIFYGEEQQLLTNMKVDGTEGGRGKSVMMLSLMEHIQNLVVLLLLIKQVKK